MGRLRRDSCPGGTCIRGYGRGFRLAVVGLSLGVHCSPGPVHSGAEAEDGGPTDAVDVADVPTEDVAESTDEVAPAEDGRDADAGDDAAEHVLSCDDPVWMDWAGLDDAGDGCQEVLREPGSTFAGSSCFTAGGGDPRSFRVRAPRAPSWCFRARCAVLT